MSALPSLPCYPCPHQSNCCSWGTTVTDDEAAAILAEFGGDYVYQTRWGEWRTRVRGGRCAFMQGNTCIIHDRDYYPEVCRCFPWRDAETGGPYEFDQTICPEFILRPELIQIGRALEAPPSRPS
ncbi:MAG TPA: hypothetical protein VFN83_08135 [Gemmatimonadales bacterium]|nr:hypothetical protein [Gemmatimonadales bacterium]